MLIILTLLDAGMITTHATPKGIFLWGISYGIAVTIADIGLALLLILLITYSCNSGRKHNQ
jgi:hypothetical protein